MVVAAVAGLLSGPLVLKLAIKFLCFALISSKRLWVFYLKYALESV